MSEPRAARQARRDALVLLRRIQKTISALELELLRGSDPTELAALLQTLADVDSYRGSPAPE